MPIPRPRKGQKKQDYVSETIEFLTKEGGRPKKQIAAIAYSEWNRRGQKPKRKSK